jgi:hypothetical protein
MKAPNFTFFVSFLVVYWVATVIIAGEGVPITRIHGRVSDSFGFPVVGAKVEVGSEDGTRQFQIIADKQGSYSINNLSAGRYRVLVSSLGFATEERNILVWDGDQVILDIGLRAGGAQVPPIEVSGMVRQLDNVPLEDATVTVANAFNDRLVQRVRTDTKGHYSVSVDNPGQYIVSASKAGFIVSALVKVLPATLPRKQFEANFILTQLRRP